MLPEHWYDKLERRLEWLSIPGLASFLVGMNAIVWVMTMFKPEFPYMLILDPGRVLAGEWWRVLTFAVVPPMIGPIWMLFWLMILYTYATALENEWGDFRFNLFYGTGVLATAAASLISGYPISNVTLHTSIFLAFAALYPDFQLLLFFVLPVKVRWLAWLGAAMLLWRLLFHGPAARWEILSGLLNYLLFFGRDHGQTLAWHWRRRGR